MRDFSVNFSKRVVDFYSIILYDRKHVTVNKHQYEILRKEVKEMSGRFELNRNKKSALGFSAKLNNRKKHEIASASIFERP